MFAGGNPVLLIVAVATLVAVAVLVRMVKVDCLTGRTRPASNKAGEGPDQADGPVTRTHDGPVSHSGSGAPL
jgi:hypothetical protein